MSEHTPGPWKVDSKYCVGPVSQEDDQSYGMIIPVADVYGPNRKADAELIASAPQLREQIRVLREALEEFCKATEYVASRMAYQCGLGAGEWEAFIDQTNYYKQYKQGKAALTATSQEVL